MAAIGPVTLGRLINNTGTVFMTGGQLVITNKPATVGAGSGLVVDGSLVLSNGALIVTNVASIVGNTGVGTITIITGSMLSTNLVLGNFACSATGIVGINGGGLFMTNAAAALEVRSGTLTFNSGTLVLNKLVLTNSCSRFISAIPAAITTTNILPNLDADGDGLPNDWEQSFGLNPFNNTGNDGASGDPDGDGVSNLNEFNLGSDPTNASSIPGTNSWVSASSGLWGTAGNWNAGRPTNTQSLILITNASTKSVTIDASTPTANRTVSNLTVSGPAGTVNTLQLSNAGTATPLRILDAFVLSTNAVLVITNSALRLDGVSTPFTINGAVTNLADGQITATNGDTSVGLQGIGRLTLNGGSTWFADLYVGNGLDRRS